MDPTDKPIITREWWVVYGGRGTAALHVVKEQGVKITASEWAIVGLGTFAKDSLFETEAGACQTALLILNRDIDQLTICRSRIQDQLSKANEPVEMKTTIPNAEMKHPLGIQKHEQT